MRRLSILCVLCLSFAATLAESATANAAVLIGDQHVEATTDGGSSPGSEAFGYTATSSGTARSISVYLDSTGGITVGLYTSGSGSRPAARLATASNTSNTAHAWATIPIPAVTINSGTRYWIALGGNGGLISYRDKGSSGSNLDYSGTGFANPYSRTGQWNSNPVSAYVSTASALGQAGAYGASRDHGHAAAGLDAYGLAGHVDRNRAHLLQLPVVRWYDRQHRPARRV
jgi:hypothetical protein